MFEKIKKILQNTFISTFSYTLTVLTILLIVNNGNILIDGTTNKIEENVSKDSVYNAAAKYYFVKKTCATKPRNSTNRSKIFSTIRACK